MWNSKIWLQLLIWWSLKISGFGHFRVFINFLIANMYYEIRNRMAMKEKTVHSMKNFNFSGHIENKIVTFSQLIVKNFHLRCGVIGCMMSNQWCLTCFHLFLSWCITSVLKNWYEMWNSKIWLQPLIWWSLKISVFGHFGIFFDFLIANMYNKIRNRMAMKEKTVHSMKNFNFCCHIENKIVTFSQLIVKNFHLRHGLIGSTMSNQWCLTCFHLFLSWCNTSVLKKLVWDVKL